MLLASCSGALDRDAIAVCWLWIEEQLKLGKEVVVLLDDAGSFSAIKQEVTPSPHFHCIQTTACTTVDDFVLFGVIYGAMREVAPTQLLRFTGQKFDPLGAEADGASHLYAIAVEARAALNNRDANQAWSSLGLLRKLLLPFPGALSAILYQRAGDCKQLIDLCRLKYLSALQSGSLFARARAKPLEMWGDMLSLLDQASRSTNITAWPDVASDLQRIQAFIASGQAALAADAAAISKNNLPTLRVMLWLAAYLVRTSEHYLSHGDGAAAVALSVRSLETYIDFRLFEFQLLVLDPQATRLIKTSSGQQLFAKYKNPHGDGVRAALMVLTDPTVLGGVPVSDVEMVIDLRNRCAFAHGVQRLSVGDAQDALTRVKTFIKTAERTRPVGPRWDQLLSESFLIDWTSVGPRVFSGLWT
jgi:hypothetical protein